MTRTRIDTTQVVEKWQYKCPECDSTNWRCHNATLGCRACDTTIHGLVDDSTGEFIPREEIEFVGPYANDKAVRSYPKGRGPNR